MSTIRAPSRSLLRALKAPTSKCCCQRIAIRSISTTEGSVPRWSRTPTGMSAPVRVRARPKQEFKVNEDPTKLDAMYNRLLGQNGSKMLHDETKWLAITHKSFDQGRRGFNDRLSFMGRQILEVQTSIGLLNTASTSGYSNLPADEFGRDYFNHQATDGIEILNHGGKQFILSIKQISNVARQYGLQSVVRWQPKDTSDLNHSGENLVLTQAIFAIVGALAMEQGGTVANRVARERILLPAGLNNVSTKKQDQIV